MAAMSRACVDRKRRALLVAGASGLLLATPRAHAASSWPDAVGTAAMPRLDEALASGAQVSGLRAVAVARDGQLLAERFYGGAAPGQLFRINSATKSVCSVLVGIALAQGKLRNLSQTVAELLPEVAAAHPDSPAARV